MASKKKIGELHMNVEQSASGYYVIEMSLPSTAGAFSRLEIEVDRAGLEKIRDRIAEALKG